jgi:hypothetical protein
MKTARPFKGLSVPRGMAPALARRKIAAGALLAGGATPAGVYAPNPLGVGLDGAGNVTVDQLTQQPTYMTQAIADMTAENEGFWIGEVFNTPGLTVQGGAVIFDESFPSDHFLPAGHSLRPRAPGSEAPRVEPTRRAPQIARPESWAAALEVTDEHRRRNNMIAIQDALRKIANTFAYTLQLRGEQTLDAALTRWASAGESRSVVNPPGSDWAAADPIENTTSTDARPSAEFARVNRLFTEDMLGLSPDTLILSPEDAEHLDRIYGDRLTALLGRYNLRLRTSVRRVAGERLYVRSGQIGTIAFEKPLGAPAYQRYETRWTDEYAWETVPVFVANGANSILKVVKS